MKIRLVVALLFAGALAFACGPRSRSSEGSAAAMVRAPLMRPSMISTRGSMAAVRRHDASVALTRQPVRLESRLDVRVAADIVHFAFDVQNSSARRVELNFRNGQSYDFVVVDSLGHEVWRWAASRLFTQSIRNKQLGKGESLRMQERWLRPTGAGRYTAIATLTSSNYPLERRAEFIVPAGVNIAATR